MELRDLKYFCLTAEMEHVTKAADKLGIAQPFLTKVIKQIEDEIGCKLFEKNGRRIKLNANGEVLYRMSKKILYDMENLYTEMDYVLDRKEQTITLMCNTESFYKRFIREFHKIHPDYAISVLQATQPEMIEALNTGETDFALSFPISGMENQSNIITEMVFYEEGIILLPPNHPLLNRSCVTLDDLRNERLVTMPRFGGMRNQLEPVFEKYDFHPNIVCETNNLHMLTEAVSNGMGYAFVTKLIIDDHPEMLKYCVDLDLKEKFGYCGLSYNRFALENRYAAHFRDFTINFLNELEEYLYG